MIHTAYFFGDSPLCFSLQKQLESRGWHTWHSGGEGWPFDRLEEGDRIVVVSDDDNHVLPFLFGLARQVSLHATSNAKVRTLLVLQQELTLRVLYESDFPKEVSDVLDIDAVTQETIWAERVLCGMPAGEDETYPPLDRSPMMLASQKRVMLVVDGMDAMAQAMACTAALVAHYPNYVRDTHLATRIVMVHPDMQHLGHEFRLSHHPLFRCSAYRVTDLSQGSPKVLEVHQPELAVGCSPFVDVEWEFVCGSLEHPVMQSKLAHWATDGNWLLSLALCEGSDERLLNRAMNLPQEIRDGGCTTYVRQSDAVRVNALRRNPQWQHLHAFGMEGDAFDALMPQVELARMLNAFYSPAAGAQGFPYNLQPEAVRQAWYGVPSPALRHSNVCNVLTFRTKMRSLGHEESEPHTFYALSESEVRLLAEVEHNRWSLERLMAGFRPPTLQERENISRNIQQHISARKEGQESPDVDLKKKMKNEASVHYDLCAYSELSVDASGRDVRDYDYELIACIPLIMAQWREMMRKDQKEQNP